MTALVDSRAQASFMNAAFICKHKLDTVKLPVSQQVTPQNANCMLCKDGPVKEECHLLLTYQGHREWIRLLVSNTGSDDVVLGHNWL